MVVGALRVARRITCISITSSLVRRAGRRCWRRISNCCARDIIWPNEIESSSEMITKPGFSERDPFRCNPVSMRMWQSSSPCPPIQFRLKSGIVLYAIFNECDPVERRPSARRPIGYRQPEPATRIERISRDSVRRITGDTGGPPQPCHLCVLCLRAPRSPRVCR